MTLITEIDIRNVGKVYRFLKAFKNKAGLKFIVGRLAFSVTPL